MAEYTQHYGLVMPAEDDFYDVADANGNMEIIDAVLKAQQDAQQVHADRADNPHGVTAAQVGASNPNMLINWDFRNPATIVDQRGGDYSAAVGTIQYTIDRHRVYNCGLTKKPGYIELTAPPGVAVIKFFSQIIDETKPAPGETYTLSAIARVVGGTMAPRLQLAMTANGAGQGSEVEIPQGGGFELYQTTYTTPSNYSDTRCAVYMRVGNEVADSYATLQIAAWKLERGAASTLLNDPPQSYGAELAKCQRYYEKLEGLIGYIYANYSSGVYHYYIPIYSFKATKRALPKLRLYTGAGDGVFVNLSGTTIAGATIESSFPSKDVLGTIVISGITGVAPPAIYTGFWADAEI